MLKPNFVDKALDEAYLAMAEDMAREAEAVAWCKGLAGDIGDMADQIMAADKARLKTRLGILSKDDLLLVEDAIKVHLGLPR